MKLALLSLLILGTMLAGSEAYCPCDKTCTIKLVVNRPQCCPLETHIMFLPVCVKHGDCDKRKRSVEPEIDAGFPCDFAEYDTDGNGQISRDELLATLHMKKSQAVDLDRPFKVTDKDGDGGIDCGEFTTSNFEFKCEPHGCKHA